MDALQNKAPESGWAKGWEQGWATGWAAGEEKAKVKLLENLMKNLNYSPSEAIKAAGIPEKQAQHYLDLLERVSKLPH